MQRKGKQLVSRAIRAVMDKMIALERGISFQENVRILSASIRIAIGKIMARQMVSKFCSYAVPLLLKHSIRDYSNAFRFETRSRQEHSFFQDRIGARHLSFRQARCACGRTTYSRNSLCDFEYRGAGSPWAAEVCICGYHRVAHDDAIKGESASLVLRSCPGFRACGGLGYDLYWCGCAIGQCGVYRTDQGYVTAVSVPTSLIANYRSALIRMWFRIRNGVVDPYES